MEKSPGAFYQFLKVEELVGDFFGGECVENSHDPSGEVEVRGTSTCDENACMRAVFPERCLVQPFVVSTIVGEYGPLAGGRKLKLHDIGSSQILGLPGCEHLKPVWAQELSDKD